MSDIDVTFATNAGATAKQIDQVALSTKGAAVAARDHARASQEQVKAIGMTLQAARLSGTATKEEIATLRQAQFEAKKRANDAKQSAMVAVAAYNAERASSRQARVEMLEKAKAARTIDVEKKKESEDERRRVMQGAYFLGMGRGSGVARGLLGAGAGAASLVVTTLALTGVGVAIGALTGAIGSWLESSKEQAKRMAELTKSLDDSLKDRGDRGLAAAKEFGPQLRALTALGSDKMSLANNFAGNFGFGDSSEAVLLASKLFPKDYIKALEEANDAALITGKTLTASMENLKGMPVKTFNEFGAAGASLATMAFGAKTSRADFITMGERIENSDMMSNLSAISGAQGQLDILGINSLRQGVIQIQSQTSQALTAPVEAAKALTEEFRKAADSVQRFNSAFGGDSLNTYGDAASYGY